MPSGAGPSSRTRELPVAVPPPLLPQGPARPPRVSVLGPCFSCGQYGHLARMCPKKTVYPLSQSVVSKTEIHKSTVYPSEGCGQTAVLKGPTSEVEVQQSVDKCKAFEANDINSADYVENPDEPGWESDIKFWEVEADSPSSQITDVRGWLRKNLKFWQEVF